MTNYHEKIKELQVEDSEGNITITTTKESKRISKYDEPDYIKLYTKLFLNFNDISEKYHRLFIELALRMTYPDANDKKGGQIVHVAGSTAKAIMNACGWKTKDPLYKGLKVLCEKRAIKRISRGEYQINPEYAGKGAWYYNPRLKQGGIKNLITKFNFQEKTVDTRIIWASTKKEEIGSNLDEVIATHTTITPDVTADEQWEGIT